MKNIVLLKMDKDKILYLPKRYQYRKFENYLQHSQKNAYSVFTISKNVGRRIISMFFFILMTGKYIRSLNVSAESAIIMCADSRDVIWSKNADVPRAMASTTKIMTSLLTLEEAAAQGERSLEITDEMVRVEGSSMGLRVGDKVDLETLAKGMLLPSGNDAANAAAILVCGSVEKFLKRMNDRAKQIGMKNTLFCTPSGLDKGDHHSTAYDMAVLGSYAIENEQFAKIVSEKHSVVDFEDSDKKVWLKNHNKLLSMYPYCVGIKTGFTKKAGRCLVSCAEKDGIRLVCVTLDAPDDWNDHISLYNFGFSKAKVMKFDDTNESIDINVKDGEKTLKSIGSTYFSRTFASDVNPVRSIKIFENLHAPIKKGQCVGKIIYKVNDNVIGENLLTALEDINCVKKGFFRSILNFFCSLFSNIIQFFSKLFVRKDS